MTNNNEKRTKALELIKEGSTKSAAARAVGVTPSTMTAWTRTTKTKARRTAAKRSTGRVARPSSTDQTIARLVNSLGQQRLLEILTSLN